jgi:hypothetical protein
MDKPEPPSRERLLALAEAFEADCQVIFIWPDGQSDVMTNMPKQQISRALREFAERYHGEVEIVQ